MYRLRAVSTTIREVTPPAIDSAFAVITELGGLAFILIVLSVLYWLEDRQATATVIGYVLVALSLTVVLKAVFELPRPPESVRLVAVNPGSYGFPSGHAITSTVVYGGLVLTRENAWEWRYALLAAVLVALIGLSRVVIGVHFLGNVLVGHAIGLVLLGGLWVTVGRRADQACLVAAVVTGLGLLGTSVGSYALLGFGASLGGIVAFHSTHDVRLPRPSGFVETVPFVAIGLAFAGGTFYVARIVTIVPVIVLSGAVLVAGVVLLPHLLETSLFEVLPAR